MNIRGKIREWIAELSEYGFYGLLWMIGLTVVAIVAAALAFLRAFGFDVSPPKE